MKNKLYFALAAAAFIAMSATSNISMAGTLAAPGFLKDGGQFNQVVKTRPTGTTIKGETSTRD